MKKFRVKVRLSDSAVADAKAILRADMLEKRSAVAAFNAKYCSQIYTGAFSAGGWFRTIATATSNKAMEFSALEQVMNISLECCYINSCPYRNTRKSLTCLYSRAYLAKL